MHALSRSFVCCFVLLAGCNNDGSSSSADAAGDAAGDGPFILDGSGVDGPLADAKMAAGDFAGAPDDLGTGAACGGFAGTPCAAGTFCNYSIAMQCGAGDVPGTCEAKPAQCNIAGSAVCGCDNHDYASACDAHMAGTSVARVGACTPV